MDIAEDAGDDEEEAEEEEEFASADDKAEGDLQKSRDVQEAAKKRSATCVVQMSV